MSVRLVDINALLQYPCVRVSEFRSHHDSTDVSAEVVAYDDLGHPVERETVRVDFREIVGLDLEGALKLVRDRVNDGKEKLAKRLEDQT